MNYTQAFIDMAKLMLPDIAVLLIISIVIGGILTRLIYTPISRLESDMNYIAENINNEKGREVKCTEKLN